MYSRYSGVAMYSVQSWPCVPRMCFPSSAVSSAGTGSNEYTMSSGRNPPIATISEITIEGETTVLGVLADSVQEVLDLDPDHIEPAPRIGTKLNTEFIQGMGKHNDQFIILLDIDKVFSFSELAATRGMDGEPRIASNA